MPENEKENPADERYALHDQIDELVVQRRLWVGMTIFSWLVCGFICWVVL